MDDPIRKSRTRSYLPSCRRAVIAMLVRGGSFIFHAGLRQIIMKLKPQHLHLRIWLLGSDT